MNYVLSPIAILVTLWRVFIRARSSLFGADDAWALTAAFFSLFPTVGFFWMVYEVGQCLSDICSLSSADYFPLEFLFPKSGVPGFYLANIAMYISVT